ncbi:MAG TPA: autotransporter domain-containing protein, partial [Ramlibacter sp.]|nr:autotransporter domain-containing protein [Ramlibacter sp.]
RVGDGTTAGQNMTARLDAAIAGTGGIVKSDLGTLVLAGENTYTGGTTIGAGTLQISRDANLGAATGGIALEGGTLRATQDLQTARVIEVRAGGGGIDSGTGTMTATGALTGTGDWVKLGAGTLVLAGTNASTGTATVAAGTLRAGAAGAFGPAAGYAVAAGARRDLAGFDQTVSSLTNAGTVSLSGAGLPVTLRVQGNYVGQDGVLRLSGVLGGNDSPVDRLVIDGGTASGRTSIQFANLGGLGAQTTADGIELVSAINGATTTAQTTRDAFSLAGGRVSAGAFEYRLHPGDASGAGESWYLRSTLPTAAAPTAYRPEVALNAALAAVARQADLAMVGNLYLRQGDVLDATPEAGDVPRGGGWARVIHQDARIRQEGTVSPRSDASLTGVQAGIDLLAQADHRVGVYWGSLWWSDRVSGFAGGVDGAVVGTLDGRSDYLGLYWTYRASDWYSDVVLQKGWLEGNADASTGTSSQVRGRGTLVSFELGKTFKLNDAWGLEPQAQLIVGRQRVDDVAIPAAILQQEPQTHVTGRFGVRIVGDVQTRAGRARPYGRVNLWHGFSGTDRMTVTGPGGAATVETRRGHTSVEIASGGTLAFSRQVSVYGELGFSSALGGDQRVRIRPSASVGMRVSW